MKNKFLPFSEYVNADKDPIYLYKNLWKEKSTALIYGKRNAGKRTLALDVADAVMAQGNKVIYVTTDMGLRAHTSRLAGKSNLMVFTPEFESPDDKRDYADIVMQGIEEAAKEGLAKIFIIDSVTRIAALSFGRNASVSYIMKRLVAMQMRFGVSLLVIAHDPMSAAKRTLISYADVIIPLPESESEQKANDRRSDAPAAGKSYDRVSAVNRYSGSGGANRQFLAKHPSR